MVVYVWWWGILTRTGQTLDCHHGALILLIDRRIGFGQRPGFAGGASLLMMAVVAITDVVTVPGRCFDSGSAQHKDHHQQATDPAHLSRFRLHGHVVVVSFLL